MGCVFLATREPSIREEQHREEIIDLGKDSFVCRIVNNIFAEEGAPYVSIILCVKQKDKKQEDCLLRCPLVVDRQKINNLCYSPAYQLSSAIYGPVVWLQVN